jgi:hypothetical protein
VSVQNFYSNILNWEEEIIRNKPGDIGGVSFHLYRLDVLWIKVLMWQKWKADEEKLSSGCS